MNLEMNYLDRTELAKDAVPGTYDEYSDTQLDGLITRASMLMRRFTKGALYAVDEYGMPTDPRIRDAFRDATSAQVLAWVQSELVGELLTDGATAEASVASSTNNGSSVTFDTSVSTTARARLLSGGLADGALLILEDAGLIGVQPWIRV
ncbi:hypothetical protein ACL1FX_00185 [Corynebacterium striatum]